MLLFFLLRALPRITQLIEHHSVTEAVLWPWPVHSGTVGKTQVPLSLVCSPQIRLFKYPLVANSFDLMGNYILKRQSGHPEKKSQAICFLCVNHSSLWQVYALLYGFVFSPSSWHNKLASYTYSESCEVHVIHDCFVTKNPQKHRALGEANICNHLQRSILAAFLSYLQE